jgi:CubicO group peptidase (beta-lactamase class C family)
VGRRALSLLAVALVAAGCGSRNGTPGPVGQVSAAAAVHEGFAPAKLRAADRRFRATPALASVLVSRHGRLVFERYYRGARRSEDANVFSVTKSVVSALVGIALREGKLRSLDQRLVDFFPGELAAGTDPRVRTITLRDLLTMTSGYREPLIAASDDWVRTLLNRPLSSDPGTAFSYDDGSAHLAGAALAQATGETLQAYAQRKLFGPLGIHPARWSTDGQGHSLGSTGLFLRPRDLLRLGELYLEDGRWHGRQVVPASWVRESTRTHVRIPHGYAYGYFWWVDTGPHSGFLALGYAGQTIAVFPKLGLVVTTTGGGTFDVLGVLRPILAALGSGVEQGS